VHTSDNPGAAELPPGEPRPQLRAAALTAVIAGLVLVAAAAFVLSYQGIHQLALNAGVTPELARLYPVILDAMLVMSGAAALALRTAGVWTRCYVWACLILLLAALAAGNAVYALHISLPAQPTRAVAAVLPWALLLLGFGMLLAMLRHWRQIQAASDAAGPAVPGDGVAAATPGAASGAGSPGSGPAKPGAPRSSIEELMEPRSGQPPERARAAAAGAAAAGAAAAGAAGVHAGTAGEEAAGGKRAGPATSPESTGTSRRDDAAPRPPGRPAEERPAGGPAVGYEAQPTAPGGTAGPARANGPTGTTQIAAGPPPDGTSAAAPPAGAVPATTSPAETAPATTPPGGTAPTPPTGPVPAAAAPADAGPRPPDTTAPPGTTEPFLDRILGGPTNPHTPEADGE